jgi:FG-GAP-like repeat
LDGDLDIATISFFPDPTQKPNEGFVLLKNVGNNVNFKPSAMKGADQGKWMTMDVADMDNDGDIDIALGSFFKDGLQNNKNNKYSNKLPKAIILENTIRQ